jgi:hypothetical protein
MQRERGKLNYKFSVVAMFGKMELRREIRRINSVNVSYSSLNLLCLLRKTLIYQYIVRMNSSIFFV